MTIQKDDTEFETLWLFYLLISLTRFYDGKTDSSMNLSLHNEKLLSVPSRIQMNLCLNISMTTLVDNLRTNRTETKNYFPQVMIFVLLLHWTLFEMEFNKSNNAKLRERPWPGTN